MLKRKRSISPIRYGRSISDSKQQETSVYRIMNLADGIDGFKIFIVEFPSKYIDAFRNCSHYHICQEIPRPTCCTISNSFMLDIPSKVFAETTWSVYGKPVFIGSTMYASASERIFSWTKWKLRLLTLDLDFDNKDMEWKELKIPTNFDIKVTDSTVLASVHGRLFILGAYPSFGYIFDTKTNVWSVLEGPNGVKLNTFDISFIASLGDSVGKLLLTEYFEGGLSATNFGSWLHLYEVDSNEWETHKGCDQPIVECVFHMKILGTPIVVHDVDNNPTLCFMDNWGMFHVFDLKTMKLFQGYVLGFDECGLRSYLEDEYLYTSFLHFGGDLFFLCFPKSIRNPDGSLVTFFHYVFIRVAKRVYKDEEEGDEEFSLEAFIVGCLEESVDGHFYTSGAFFV